MSDTGVSRVAAMVADREPGTRQKRDILGIEFDLIDYDTVLTAIHQWRQAGHRKYVTLTNPHSVMLCQRDPAMWLATEGAGLTLPDGVGVILAARMLGYLHNGRVDGPTLMLWLCDWGRWHGYRHYFYGGREGVADRLAGRLCAAYPGLAVVGTYSPPFRPLTEEEDAALIEKINSARPDIVWVGLGAPKQEKWMAAYVGRVEAAAMIGVGAAFDFHSGNVRRAPPLVRWLGLEWFFRLVYEPRRMWRRYLLDGPHFLLKVFAQRLVAMRSAQ